MGILKDRFLIFMVLLGLFTRLLFINLPGFSIDVNDWFAWSLRLSNFNFAQFYSKDIFTDYTPGYMYVLGFLGFLKNILQINTQTFYFLLKLPAIFAEITLGVLIYKELKNNVSIFYTRLAAGLIFLNPALIFNSSVWGQIDGVLTLTLFLAIYYLKNKKLLLSSTLLGISLLIKPQTISILPIFLIFAINNFSIKNITKITLPFLFIIFIFSLPFFNKNPFFGLISLIINTASQYPYTTLFAYNFWGIIGSWIPDSIFWNGLTYQTWGYILLTSYWIMIGYFFFKKKLSVYALATLATLGFFFLPTRVHERYLYPAIVFLILLTAYYKSKSLLILTGALTFLHLLNLYYVYVYYNEFYLKLPKILYNPIIYNFLDTNSKELSLISSIVFILIVISIIKYDTSAYQKS